VILSNKNIEAVEYNDNSKVGESCPGSVWLEPASEHKSITIHSLRLERLMELDIGDTDRGPGEKGSDCNQVLEPDEGD
jgi:hypothetical protein